MSIRNPQNESEIRKVVEERIVALRDLKDAKETVTVEWRGSQIHIPVISMPVELVTYNPGTHRIRAQRSTDPTLEIELNNDPWGDLAQSYLHTLLMGDPSNPSKIDPSFTALKEDLRDHGQSDPGIISRTGVLINGNTRRAALKELGQANIRVGVLPSDAGHDDLQSIELSLQLRKDHRRDYSFMNFLLAIEERVIAGQIPALIQKDFRIKASVFDRCRWILDFVKEAIERSTVTMENSVVVGLNLVEFESHQGKLEELHRAYCALAPKSLDEAKALREQRLLAIVLSKSKTDLRLIEPDFVKRYMKEHLPMSEVSAPRSIPGTSITVPGPNQEVVALRKLTTEALRAKAVSTIELGATTQEAIKANNFLAKLDESLNKALDHAGKQLRVVKKRFAAVDRLSDACDNLDYAIDAVAQARSTSNFDAEDLDEILVTLKAKLDKLSFIVARSSDSESEGLTWLRAITTVSGKRG